MTTQHHFVTATTVVATFLTAFVLTRVSRAVMRRAIGSLEDSDPAERRALDARARQLARSVSLVAYGVAAVVSVSFALARFGIGDSRTSPRDVYRWMTVHGVNIAVIVIGAFVVVRTCRLLIATLQHRLKKSHERTDLEWHRRATTIGGILGRLVTVFVGFTAILMLLRELSIDVLPILTGAGIAGLAIGFGAQNLVRDVISGFFLILEDQVRVGDQARINGVAGIVEAINLRTIMLRDFEGAVQVFPNGTITALANLSKQFAYATVDVKIAYSENIDRVMGTIREAAALVQASPQFGPLVMAPVEILGVDSIADGGVNVRARFKTLPLNQAKVANELRRRLVPLLVRRGIKPYA